MERKFLQHNWREMRTQLSEWWDDFTDEDLDMINTVRKSLSQRFRSVTDIPETWLLWKSRYE